VERKGRAAGWCRIPGGQIGKGGGTVDQWAFGRDGQAVAKKTITNKTSRAIWHVDASQGLARGGGDVAFVISRGRGRHRPDRTRQWRLRVRGWGGGQGRLHFRGGKKGRGGAPWGGKRGFVG